MIAAITTIDITTTPLDRSDDVEIAQRVLADIARAGDAPLTMSAGDLYWRPRGGAWIAVWDRHLSQLVCRYAGIVVGERGRVLHVSASRVASVVRLMRALVPLDAELREKIRGGW